MTTQSLSYAIDEHDHLIRVDEGYYRFAEENGWTAAGSSLGRSLWDYVSGRELVKLQRLLVRRVRDEVGDVELSFRCDAPALRREMDMRIVARPRNSGRHDSGSVQSTRQMRGFTRRIESSADSGGRAN